MRISRYTTFCSKDCDTKKPFVELYPQNVSFAEEKRIQRGSRPLRNASKSRLMDCLTSSQRMHHQLIGIHLYFVYASSNPSRDVITRHNNIFYHITDMHEHTLLERQNSANYEEYTDSVCSRTVTQLEDILGYIFRVKRREL